MQFVVISSYVTVLATLLACVVDSDQGKDIYKLWPDSPEFRVDSNPPFKATMKIGDGVVYNVTLSGIMSHNFLAGNIRVYYNMWPYEFHALYNCKGTRKELDICGAKKGEKYLEIQPVIIKDSIFVPGHYFGNASLFNQDDELIMCLIADFHLI